MSKSKAWWKDRPRPSREEKAALVKLFAPIRDAACPDCKGTGEYELGIACAACKGKGRLP